MRFFASKTAAKKAFAEAQKRDISTVARWLAEGRLVWSKRGGNQNGYALSISKDSPKPPRTQATNQSFARRFSTCCDVLGLDPELTLGLIVSGSRRVGFGEEGAFIDIDCVAAAIRLVLNRNRQFSDSLQNPDENSIDGFESALGFFIAKAFPRISVARKYSPRDVDDSLQCQANWLKRQLQDTALTSGMKLKNGEHWAGSFLIDYELEPFDLVPQFTVDLEQEYSIPVPKWAKKSVVHIRNRGPGRGKRAMKAIHKLWVTHPSMHAVLRPAVDRLREIKPPIGEVSEDSVQRKPRQTSGNKDSAWSILNRVKSCKEGVLESVGDLTDAGIPRYDAATYCRYMWSRIHARAIRRAFASETTTFPRAVVNRVFGQSNAAQIPTEGPDYIFDLDACRFLNK